MTDMRTFLAINLNAGLKQALGKIIRTLAAGGADVKWVEEQNLHLTLKFLGDTDQELLPDITSAVQQNLKAFHPFELILAGTGVFPPRGNPRVIWVGVKGDLNNLFELQRKTETALAGLGFAPENRKFSPHLTIGRIRSNRGVSRLPDLPAELAAGGIGRFTAESVDLMESRLSPQGPTYLLREKIIFSG